MTWTYSRRDFLASSSAAAIGATLGSTVLEMPGVAEAKVDRVKAATSLLQYSTSFDRETSLWW